MKIIRKLFFLITILSLLFPLISKAQSQNLPDWENPQIIGIHKLPGHASFIPYPNIKTALADTGVSYHSPYYKSLDGFWHFHWSKNPADRPVNFYKTRYNVNRWAKVKVPGDWQLEGYGRPIYLNFRYPFQPDARKLDPPHIPQNYDPVGSYRTTFTVPDSWHGRKNHSSCSF